MATLLLLSASVIFPAARGDATSPTEELALKLTWWPAKGTISTTCSGTVSLPCPSKPVTMVKVQESGGFITESENVTILPVGANPLLATLDAWAGRSRPTLPLAIAVGSPSSSHIPNKVTLEAVIHWGASKEASWVRVRISIDDANTASATATDVLSPSGIDATVVPALLTALADQLPSPSPSPAYPDDRDAKAALDAMLSILSTPPREPTSTVLAQAPAGPDARGPDPSQAGEVRSETEARSLNGWLPSRHAPTTAREGARGPRVDSTWSSSGGTGEWNATIVSPTIDDALGVNANNATRAPRWAPERPAEPATAIVGGGGSEETRHASTESANVEAPSRSLVEAKTSPPSTRGGTIPVPPAPPRSHVPAAQTAVTATIAILVLAGIGLFNRLERRKIAEQAVRRHMLDSLREHPGQGASGLAKELGVHVNTVRYHARVMLKMSLLTSTRSRGITRYFLAGANAQEKAAASMLPHGAREVYDAVLSMPGARVADLSAASQVHRTTIHHHIRLLAASGLISVEKEGNRFKLFATDKQ